VTSWTAIASCVDGQEILNYGRQAIPQFTARHRINSGAFGTMGVGMPFGVGAANGPREEDIHSSALTPYLQRVEASGTTDWSESTAEPKH
jgi:hypothetical protein